MNTMLKGLLVAAMALSAAHVQATTNHTYLAPRPTGVNLAMESVSFAELTNAKDDGRFGGDLQATVFYSKSDNPGALGRYFGFNDKNTLTTNDGGTPDRDLNKIIHYLANNRTTANTIKFAPEVQTYGVRFDYHQDLAKILDGLYFKVQLPIVKVENDLGLNVTGANATDIKNYFNGSYSVADGQANAQAALTNAKIDGKRSETGIADIDMALGYAFLNKERYRAALNIGLTIPTGTAPKGAYAFEAVIGNGGHFALGAGLEGVARVWGDEHTNIKLNAALNYRYAFEATEKRTLGVKSTSGAVTFGQYGQDVLYSNPAHEIPAANITTLNVNVTPGSMIDGIAGASYNRGGFTVDAGYNIHFKEKDAVSIKDAFTDTQYVAGSLYSYDFSGTIANHSINGTDISSNTYLTKSTISGSQAALNTDAARNESLSHKVYGQVGYIFKDMEYPVMLATGGHYEFAGNNSSVQNWGVNLKAGLSF